MTEIRLRPWEPSDAPVLVEAHRDPLLRRWLRTHLADEEQARAWVDLQTAGREEGIKIAFAVLLEGCDTPVGHISLHHLAPDRDHGEVGYWTGPAARGRGVTVAAVRAVVAEGKALDRAVPLRRFDLLHTVGNGASCGVARKAGFALVGTVSPAPPDYPDKGHLHRLTV